MTRFGAWMISSLPRFLLGAGPLFSVPLAMGFAVTAHDRGELTALFFFRIIVVSAAAGVVWALLMWPGVLVLARRSRHKR
jgi:hypothetical protein